MPILQFDSHTFDPRPHYPLLIPVKRYWFEDVQSQEDDALTLVLAHPTSFHNEHWEPVLEGIHNLVATAMSLGTKVPKIREAWAIGCPNHGDGAIWNEEVLLQERYAKSCKWILVMTPGAVFMFMPVSWNEYATSIHLVLTGKGKGIDVDFSTHNLVAIGHSMGAVSL